MPLLDSDTTDGIQAPVNAWLIRYTDRQVPEKLPTYLTDIK